MQDTGSEMALLYSWISHLEKGTCLTSTLCYRAQR